MIRLEQRAGLIVISDSKNESGKFRLANNAWSNRNDITILGSDGDRGVYSSDRVN